MKNIIRLTWYLILLAWSGSLPAQTSSDKISHGYPNGTLIVIGGGTVGLWADPGDVYCRQIMEEFRKYAGGDSAKIVVIPTAEDDEFLQNQFDNYYDRSFKKLGFSNVTILHTRDTAQANDDEFIEPLKTATGIFFTGGRQWRIADGFLNTKAHKEMFKLLDRGGVIAGSSAGASIQGSYLARGDSKTNQIMTGDHEEGLGFITNVAIDQHVLARNRQFDMFDILKKHPELLGLGIDENTAMVVHGDSFEVIGRSYVLIYDKTFWSREGSELKNLPGINALFYFLKPGDKYNLAVRKIIE